MFGKMFFHSYEMLGKGKGGFLAILFAQEFPNFMEYYSFFPINKKFMIFG